MKLPEYYKIGSVGDIIQWINGTKYRVTSLDSPSLIGVDELRGDLSVYGHTTITNAEGDYITVIKSVKNTTSMLRKISNAIKKFVSVDIQAQVKAGFRNGDLELTEEGRAVAVEMLLSNNKAANDDLTARANEVIAEAEKDK